MATRNTRQYSDFNLLFSSHPVTGDVARKNDEEAVKQSLRNLISTRHYERPFHPEIGCQIHGLLFENFNPVTAQVMRKAWDGGRRTGDGGRRTGTSYCHLELLSSRDRALALRGRGDLLFVLNHIASPRAGSCGCPASVFRARAVNDN